MNDLTAETETIVSGTAAHVQAYADADQSTSLSDGAKRYKRNEYRIFHYKWKQGSLVTFE